jgi:hypothetical protein
VPPQKAGELLLGSTLELLGTETELELDGDKLELLLLLFESMLELLGSEFELDDSKLELLLLLLGSMLELLNSLDDDNSVELLLSSSEEELTDSVELLLLSSELLYLCRTSSLLGNSTSELSAQDKKRIRASPRQNVVLLLKYIYEWEYR